MLFAFALTHLLNHSLGLISLEAMESGRDVFLGVWRSTLGWLVLPTALLVHAYLGVVQTFRLRSLRMPVWEAFQRVTGILIPIALTGHFVATRVLSWLYQFDDSYTQELLHVWPGLAVPLTIMLLVVWIHGCTGIHFWLRMRRAYRPLMPWLLGASVLIPLLALGGFVSGSREVHRLASDAAWVERVSEAENWPDPEVGERLHAIVNRAGAGAMLLIGGLIVLRGLRALIPRRSAVSIAYPDGRQVLVAAGATVLEASRSAGIPHASVCGGRGRCSTCRVRIDVGLEHLPVASPHERALLQRVEMPENVRLACQVRPTHDVAVTPLLPPHVHPREALVGQPYRYGRELEVAILFSDLRGFTPMTERRLAYDVVFVLNRYFRAMGETVRSHGGHLVQVFGDGMMVLFAAREGVPVACRQALRTASAMAARLEELNRDLEEPLIMGIGLHTGSTIVGEIGYRDATITTAVGEPVVTASRLQEATKEFGCQLVVSAALVDASGADLSGVERRAVEIRGLTRPLSVYPVTSARDLPDLGEERITGVPPLSPRA